MASSNNQEKLTSNRSNTTQENASETNSKTTADESSFYRTSTTYSGTSNQQQVACARARAPAVERQARALALQALAQPVRFSIGGVFPLDLRFFTGLLASTLGYVVVMLQFAQSAGQSAGLLAANATRAPPHNGTDI